MRRDYKRYLEPRDSDCALFLAFLAWDPSLSALDSASKKAFEDLVLLAPKQGNAQDKPQAVSSWINAGTTTFHKAK